MAKPTLLQDRFRRMVRDFPRNAMPKDTAWNLVDYIPDLGAPIRKRGGYTYASADIAATTATASYVIAGTYAEFKSGSKLIAIDEEGRVYDIVSDASTTDIGAGVVTAQNPVFHRDAVIIPQSAGSAVPKKLTWNGAAFTLADLTGSPPNGIYAAVYKDRTVLARSSVNLERLWFSDAGDPASWDTTNAFWDISFPITGLAPLRNAILVFSNGHVTRIRGSTPPPGSDFISDDPIFEVGCTDARSIALWGDNVVFANPGGIWITDGVAAADLTREAGMLTYWQELLSAYSSSYTLVGGVMRNFYFYAVMDGATFKDAGLIDIPGRSWFRLANVDASAMWRAVALSEELYFGRRGAARVGKIAPIFMPTSSVKNDGDGDAVTPVVETPYFFDRPGKKTWRNVYFTYDIRDAASDNPVLTVSYVTSPEATSYTALSPTLTETTELTRKRIPIRKAAHGLAFKITQTNASTDTRGYVIEAEVHARELSRV